MLLRFVILKVRVPKILLSKLIYSESIYGYVWVNEIHFGFGKLFFNGVLKMGFEGIVLIILTAVLVYGLISAVTGK